jgi:hypothetical protein
LLEHIILLLVVAVEVMIQVVRLMVHLKADKVAQVAVDLAAMPR